MISSVLLFGLVDLIIVNFVEVIGGVGNFVVGESEDERSNVVGFEGLDKFFGKDGFGYGSIGVGGDSIDEDVVFCIFECKSVREVENGVFLYLS